MKYKLLALLDSVRLFLSHNLFTPARLIFIVYFSITFVGFLLLSQPISIAPDKILNPVDIFFVAVSAVTVTGLSPIDISTSFTVFGEMVLLVLMQIGGLGYMAFATLGALLIGKKLGLKDRLVLQKDMDQLNMGGVVKFIKTVILIYFSIEFIGFILLSFVFVPKYGLAGFYHALFMSVSAFNSAGFTLFSDGLLSYKHDAFLNMVIILLVIVGGLGAVVMYELLGHIKFIRDRIKNRKSIDFNVFLQKPRLSLHSKIVLIMTLSLYLFGAVLIFVLESSFYSENWGQRFMEAMFLSANARSGGLNTVDIAGLASFTLMLLTFLMFTGASPASTGGGIRITTFTVILASCWATIKANDSVEIMKRTIDNAIVRRAFAIFALSLVWVSVAVLLILSTNHQPLLTVIFEVTSAFGTCGMSMGITSGVDDFGKLVLCVTMFFGRIGVLTFFIALFQPLYARPDFRYPTERIIVGG